MISFALERAIRLNCSDCTTKHYPDNSFDDNPALFRILFKCLKPGGKVLIKLTTVGAQKYIKQRGYDLHDVQAYGRCFRLR
ncbi:unnamed protein product [Eruca vesicaria subsp. sativa]|uniref:phosphoethanolamine N-methyltransferase n=1 Tax=Eruca vesicaria subsp. sativa TaxID=29727 RepID=A0ABC8LYT1_ERUVS|nr:unnamed protein product [Eruca vesicaria subsp. sativa]